MTAVLLFLKHRVPVLWTLVEWLNVRLFTMLHRHRVQREASACLQEFTHDPYTFRALNEADLRDVAALVSRQASERLAYFKPHGFDESSLRKVHRNPSFLMFGAFDADALVGYFFLRCFWNRRSFVGRLIDEPYEGRGIGRVMNRILYNTAWRSGFRCMTTISKKNHLVMRSHANNPVARVREQLPNDYLLVEFVQPQDTAVAARGQKAG